MTDPFKQKFVVLRKTGSTDIHEAGPLPTTSDGPTRGGQESVGFEVQEDELSAKELPVLKDDSTVLSFAPSMPISLIEPMDGDEPVNPKPMGTIPWGIKAVKAHESSFTGDGMTVAVLDTGIDQNHEAFSHLGSNLIVKNFTDEDVHDSNGHGTHCAGTIFGQEVDGTRIGVAPGVTKALSGKVLGEGGNTQGIISAMNWAMNNGANVISMSLGIDFPGYIKSLINYGYPESAAYSKALEAYRMNLNLYQAAADLVYNNSQFNNPCVVIAASGNESQRPQFEVAVSSPASSNNIISVGAYDQFFKIASFSNNKPDISGPGVHINSAKTGGGLTFKSGTSMATPHVAGVAALIGQQLKSQGRFQGNAFYAAIIAAADLNVNTYNFEDFGAGVIVGP